MRGSGLVRSGCLDTSRVGVGASLGETNGRGLNVTPERLPLFLELPDVRPLEDRDHETPIAVEDVLDSSRVGLQVVSRRKRGVGYRRDPTQGRLEAPPDRA